MNYARDNYSWELTQEKARRVFEHLKRHGTSKTYGGYGTVYILGKLRAYDHGVRWDHVTRLEATRITIYRNDGGYMTAPTFYEGYV
jgi:hypothetical protein